MNMFISACTRVPNSARPAAPSFSLS